MCQLGLTLPLSPFVVGCCYCYCYCWAAEFRSYFEHVRSLRFDDRPDYDYLKRLFRELFFRKGFEYDNLFDWEILNMQNQRIRAGPERTIRAETGERREDPRDEGAETPAVDVAMEEDRKVTNIQGAMSATGTAFSSSFL